jgi:hypothetical protein
MAMVLHHQKLKELQKWVAKQKDRQALTPLHDNHLLEGRVILTDNSYTILTKEWKCHEM